MINREFNLLVACCGCPPAEVPAQLVAEADAEQFVELASRHGVLSRASEAGPRLGFGNEVRELLHRRFEVEAGRALRLTSELVRVLDHLQRRGISVLPYKGAVLAQMLYGDVAARQFGDLDLLVRRRDVAAGKSALQEIGYTCALQLSEDEERAYVRSGYEYVFDRGCEKNLIELHWRIVPRFYAVEFDIDALFERSVAVQLAGRSVATLGPEDLLLVLCVHAAKHGWTKLSWLSDLVALGETVDWTVVNERAKRLGIQRIVGISFALAKMLSCGSLHIEDKEAVAIASELETFMRAGMEIDVGAADYFRLMMRVRERWWDRVRFLSRLAFTPGVREWRSVRLPGSLFPAYRLVRMWRLVSKAAV